MAVFGCGNYEDIAMKKYSGDKEKIIREFVELLPMLRARLGVTQEEFAKRVGATRQTIIYIETGKRALAWPMFLSMLFIFIMEPKTRSHVAVSGVIGKELSKILFGDTAVLEEAVFMLSPKLPLLEQAQEMMKGINKTTEGCKQCQ